MDATLNTSEGQLINPISQDKDIKIVEKPQMATL
jgi:hypothetical protein